MHIAIIGKNTDEAAAFLKNGKLVAIPTETVYGLAANALMESAVLSIFQTKHRPHFDPLIIHLHDIGQVEKFANWTDDRLQILAQKFWPGPLTLLLPKKNNVPDIVTSGLKHVAVRVPDHPLTLQLLSKIDFPLAAPSANPFGYISPTTAMHVDRQLGANIEYILDGGRCAIGLESTIVGMEGNELCVFRLGGLSVEELEKMVGKVRLKINLSGDPKAPGQLKSHYAPRKKLFFGDLYDLTRQFCDNKSAVISFGGKKYNCDKFFDLSPGGDINEAASKLFSTLRDADESDVEVILAGKVPDEGLGIAINDRLKRAAV